MRSERPALKGLEVRELREKDAEIISAAFRSIGWGKPVEQYLGYLKEQKEGRRKVLVAFLEGRFCGYVTLRWKPEPPYREGKAVPEVNDFNVLPEYRRRGIGSRLMDLVEAEAATVSDEIGLGVGMHPGYGSAQRMYVKRGYVPDGKGIFYKDKQALEGQVLVNDDDLVLRFTKRLR